MVKKLCFLMLFSILVACQKSGEDIDTKQGVIKVRLLTDSIDVVASKSTPQLADLNIRIENTRGENLRQWTYGELPEEIRMVSGSYRLVAWYGRDDVFPSWDAQYWQGEYKFKIEAGEMIDAPLVVKPGVAQVKVEFDESFDNHYTLYSADVRTTTPATPQAGFLNYTPRDIDQIGSYLPGTLRLRLHVTSKLDGKEYEFVPSSPISVAKAAQLYNLNLKVTSVNGDATLVVTTDGEVIQIPITLSLPNSILPKAPPRLRSVGFAYDTQGLIYSQGNAPTEKMAAAIEAPAGIRGVWIIAKGAALKRLWNNTSKINIVGITQDQRNALFNSGFRWSEVLSDPITAAKALARVEVRFDEMFSKLTCQTSDLAHGSDYSFEIQIEDTFNQTNTGTSTFDVTSKINPPVFSMVTPTQGNVWAKSAEFEMHYSANVEGAEPYVEIYQNGVWARANQSTRQIATGVKYYTINGLTPNTEYKFRGSFGEHSLPQYTFTTEVDQPIVNGNMESWQAEQLSVTIGSKISYYRPWASSDTPYWTTNNDRTTDHRGSFVYGYNSFPTVSYTKNAYDGTFAAEIRTTSAVYGNTVDISYDKLAGLLYVGNYSYTDSKELITEGMAHSSRPVAFKFYYTYENYNGDSFDARLTLWSGDKLIGQGVYRSEQGEAATSFTSITVPVEYTDRLLRADRMTVVFRSTVKSAPEVRKRTIDLDFVGQEDYNKGWKVHVGSILRVDNIELVY